VSAAQICFLCGSGEISWSRYINARALGLPRYLAYQIPVGFAEWLARRSAAFAKAWRSVSTNRRYFDVDLCYCAGCGTGSAQPLFEEARLSRYYAEYYWDNRDEVDGRHLTEAARPNELQLGWSAERIEWLERHLAGYASVIDFGAGDCAAGFVLRGQAKVFAVDPSAKARMLAGQYGIEWRGTLAECPEVELLYASHSLEHVHDLIAVFGVMLGKVRPGGHMFFEVPNVASKEIFDRLYQAPHTFSLCRGSFEQLAQRFDCRIVAMEDVGQSWQIRGHTFRDRSKADLRVLIQRG
jgi:SAM-dependent methyltransferase